jgi:hypothetical protein
MGWDGRLLKGIRTVGLITTLPIDFCGMGWLLGVLVFDGFKKFRMEM